MENSLFVIWVIGFLFSLGWSIESQREHIKHPSFAAAAVVSVFWPVLLPVSFGIRLARVLK